MTYQLKPQYREVLECLMLALSLAILFYDVFWDQKSAFKDESFFSVQAPSKYLQGLAILVEQLDTTLDELNEYLWQVDY